LWYIPNGGLTENTKSVFVGDMVDIKQIIEQIGTVALANALGCSASAVNIAAQRGYFPASWYPTVQKIAFKQLGHPVPLRFFNWRCPSDVEMLQGRNVETAGS
jgi:hypothetical protein